MTIIRNAIQAPLRTIVENAGGEASVVVNEVLAGKADYGLNAENGEYVNMFKACIIDPTKVTRLTLENAASIASLLLTTECVVAEEPEKEGAAPMPSGGMGGMI
ncbi:MAG: TCP-1/cpn60 chaperonin family protein [Marinobacter alexandrii]